MFRSALALAALSLAACSTSVAPDGPNNNNNNTPDTPVETPSDFTARASGTFASESVVRVQLAEIGSDGSLIALSSTDAEDDGSFTIDAPANRRNLVILGLDASGSLVSSGFLDRTEGDNSDNYAGVLDQQTHVETRIHIELVRDGRSEDDIDHNEIRRHIDADIAAEVDSQDDINALAIGLGAYMTAESRSMEDNGLTRSQSEMHELTLEATAELMLDLATGMDRDDAEDNFLDNLADIEAQLGIDAWIASESEARAGIALRLAVMANLDGEDDEGLLDAVIDTMAELEADIQLDLSDLLSSRGQDDEGIAAALDDLLSDLFGDRLNRDENGESFDRYRDAVGSEDDGALIELLRDLLGGGDSDDGLDDLLDAILGGDLFGSDERNEGLLEDLLDIVNSDEDGDNDGLGGLLDELLNIDGEGGEDGLLDRLLDLIDDVNGIEDDEDGDTGALLDDLLHDLLGEDQLVDDLLNDLLGNGGTVENLLENLLGGGGDDHDGGAVENLLENLLGDRGLVSGLLNVDEEDQGLLDGLLDGINDEEDGEMNEQGLRSLRELANELEVALAIQIAADAGDTLDLRLEVALETGIAGQSDDDNAAAALWAGIATDAYLGFEDIVRDGADEEHIGYEATELAIAVQGTFRGQSASGN